MTAAEFQTLSHTLPTQAGIYKYYGEDGELLYVGKAKNLRKRVSSYFVKNHDNFKTRKLVDTIHHFEFTIVDSEQDAFLLENALIKQFRPKYNIDLKDDKTYPFIVIKHEPFPRVFLTRRYIKDGSEYLGPFTSVQRVRELLEVIKYNIPLRTCNLNLSEQNIKKGKFKVCLEYHLGNCKGPCEGLQTLEDYREELQQVKDILRGNLSPVLNQFKTQMQEHSMNLEFEKAEIMRKKIESLQEYQVRSTIVSTRIGHVDVFSILTDGEHAYVNYLRVLHGTISDTKTVTLEKKLEESDEEVLAYAVAYLREVFNSRCKEIVLPFPIEFPEEDVTITIPKGGDKKKLLDLSIKNVNYFKDELHRKKILHLEGKSDMERKKVLYQLQADLELVELPTHIECFDNSNFQGAYPVSACVVFKEGVASKKDYRHFNIKTVQGINDFASMTEVVHRRYSRLLAEQQPLPQLVIIDGGKGQLGAAMESIRNLGLIGSMTVIGLAKNEEEIFFPGDKDSIKLPFDSESLKLIRRIRDEVHRFGITFHRLKRSKGTFKNELESIKGIGESTATQLLKTFRSVAKVKALTLDELTTEVGAAKAKLVFEHFHPTNNASKDA
ncbi:excinuclease ABC subunit C [Chitinophaga skermanii]|uniref:UvrABC system protein C n=1 Tax=Chitinophaga skermanii TaxID=331697 RepID=A0A327QJJ9_9BACT|nr:excinuclease ABC subunit UvrC [Chitinophaga skermanii]RAJ03904.1 excinuclease ABC subunit C [Chitinophaga skermanii]